MKKILLLIVLMSILALKVVSAQCGGATSYGPVLEGETVTLESSVGSDTSSFSWSLFYDENDNTIVTPVYVSDETTVGGFESPFSDENGCTVNFKAFKSGVYTVLVSDGTNSATIEVTVNDALETKGFGHNCYVVDTSNCGDIQAYGDVIALNAIKANDILAYNRIHSDVSITVGDYSSPTIYLTTALVTLSNTDVTGDLTVTGSLFADSADVSGTLTPGTSGDGILFGVIGLDKNCANGPKMYAENNDFIIELGSC